jgi:hypothetical protein
MKGMKLPKDPLLQAKHKAMRELAFHIGKSQMKGVAGRHPRVMGPAATHRKKKQEDY